MPLIVVVFLGSLAAGVVGVEVGLDAQPGVGVDEGLVGAVVGDAAEGDGALVVTAVRDLSSAGLPEPLVPSVLSAEFTLAHGHGALEAAWRNRMTETDLDELTNSLATRADTDPVVARRPAQGADRAGHDDWDFAITCLIAGITARLSETTPWGNPT